MSFPLREFFRRLADTVAKGIMRSLGDAGPSPADAPGETVLKRLADIDHSTSGAAGNLFAPGHAEVFTTAPLPAGGTYTGPVRDFHASRLAYFCAMAWADAPGTLAIEQSADAANWDLIASTDVPAGAGRGLRVAVVARYARVRYVNGPTAQTVFRLAGRYTVS